MKKLFKSMVATTAMVLCAFFGLFSNAFAVPPDFTTLTDSVDFSTAQTAILSVFAALAVVYILIRGGSLIIERIRAGR
jgi:hypothetical protein